MQLHPKQQEIVKSKKRFKVILAGRRFGKTILETEEMLFTAMTKKDSKVFYIAPTQKQARSIVWEALKKRIHKIGEANESRLEMVVPTQDGGKSIIYIAGWENRENFRGMNAHLIVFDETDTMRDFFIGWKEIFRPALTDTAGKATFIGTPKKENPNLRRLQKEAEKYPKEFECFHYTSKDNPFIPEGEVDKAQQELDPETFKQEFMAEYVDNVGALFKYTALVDMFTNTVTKTSDKYLTVDIADDGTDKTVFSFWDDMELNRVEKFSHLNTEGIINQIREYTRQNMIPMSNVAVDAIGVGAGVASSSLLDGIVGYKSSFSAIKTDKDISVLPNVHYTANARMVTDYRNLRSQCVFRLAMEVNQHRVAVKIGSPKLQEEIIEELNLYQDVSVGDGKKFATPKDQMKQLLGRSPDLTDTFLMRIYFLIKKTALPNQLENGIIENKQVEMFNQNFFNRSKNSAK